MSMRPAFEPPPKPLGFRTTSNGHGTWGRSWEILRTGWPAVRHNPPMLALAAASVATGLLAAGIALGYAYGVVHHHHKLHLAIAGIALAFPARLVTTFLGVAMCHCAETALEHGRCTARSAMRGAWRLRGPILAWSLVATVVGLILEELAERLPFVGRLAAWIGEVAWAATSFLAAAIIAARGTGPRDTLRHAGEVVRGRWGEGITGVVTIAAGLSVVTVPGLLLCCIGIGVIDAGHPATGAALVGAGALMLLTAHAAAEAVEQTFAVSLLRFAETGREDGPFAGPDFDAAVERKHRRWRRRNA
jgi:Family of unknown function (DUF6159)